MTMKTENLLQSRKPRSLWRIAWKRLAKNKLALLGLGIVIFFVNCSCFGSLYCSIPME